MLRRQLYYVIQLLQATDIHLSCGAFIGDDTVSSTSGYFIGTTKMREFVYALCDRI